MVTHMKTTIEIADPLFHEAKRLAARDATTLRELVEAGLRRVIAERRGARSVELRDARVRGRGLQTGFAGAGWDAIREAAYEGRGA